jgi:hypothetical protein
VSWVPGPRWRRQGKGVACEEEVRRWYVWVVAIALLLLDHVSPLVLQVDGGATRVERI